MQRLRNLKKNPLEIEHTFLNSKNYVEFGRFFAFEWLENLYLDTLVINEITCFLKKVLILLGSLLFFRAKNP